MEKIIIIDFILKFIIFLYGESSYPRKLVQEVVDFVSSFLRDILLNSLQSDIIAIVKKNGVNEKCISDIKTCFDSHANVFNDFSTESRRFSILEKRGFFFPEEFPIGELYVKKTCKQQNVVCTRRMFWSAHPVGKNL